MCALVRIIGGHDPDVCVVGAVGIRSGAVAAECQKLAVRRPGGLFVIEVAGGDLGQNLAGKIEGVEMGAAALKIADFIDLELVAVDNPRALGFCLFVFGVVVLAFGFGFRFRLLQFLRGRVLQHEDEAFAVGRPGKLFDVLDGIGDVLGFSAEAVQQPDLGLAFIALGKKGEKLVVRAPARMRRGNLLGSHGKGIPAGRRYHPDARLLLVVFQG